MYRAMTTKRAPGTLLSIGHGYCAAATVAALPPGWRVLATTRSAEKAARLAEAGLEPVIWAAGGPAGALRAALAEASHALVSVAPQGGVDAALAALRDVPAPGLRWLGYLSATSVYGDAGGGWVEDGDAPAPASVRGHERLAAEQGWNAWTAARGAGAALIRIAGIYGPGRSAFEQIASGRAQRIVKPGQVFNRIHAADLGQIVAAALAQGATGPILAADGNPAPAPDVILEACRLLGVPPPPEIPFEQATLSPMSHSFWSETKRLRPTRLGELGVVLRYPSYREGLLALKP